MLADDLENARAARSSGLDLAIAGMPIPEVEARLRSAGYAEATIGRVIPNIAKEMETAYRNNARRSLIFGLSIIGAGLLVSLFSLAAYFQRHLPCHLGGARFRRRLDFARAEIPVAPPRVPRIASGREPQSMTEHEYAPG
jgi:hypothetical protein